MMPIAVHQARGGSHELTHALVRCLLAHGGRIWTHLPGALDRDRERPRLRHPPRARGAVSGRSDPGARDRLQPRLHAHVPRPARRGRDRSRQRMQRVRYFSYDDPQLMGFHYALKDAPVFRSAAFDPAIQRCWVGYFGCDDMRDIQNAQTRVLGGEIPPATMGGWFIPTLADPGQAPPGCHTVYAWQTVPPNPRRWRGRRLNGWDAWREGLGEALLGEMTAVFEEMAPGFRDLIVEQHINTPRHQEQGNPTNVRGNMIGGSAIPEQAGENRPLPGVCVGGAARTFVPGLYLSNSIHPFGATHLASGCIAANEVAEDFGAREQPLVERQAARMVLRQHGLPFRSTAAPGRALAAAGGRDVAMNAAGYDAIVIGAGPDGLGRRGVPRAQRTARAAARAAPRNGRRPEHRRILRFPPEPARGLPPDGGTHARARRPGSARTRGALPAPASGRGVSVRRRQFAGCSRATRKNAHAPIGAFSVPDAERYLRMWDEFTPIMDEYLLPMTWEAPLPALDQLAEFAATPTGRTLARISEQSILEVVDGYGFEHPRVRLALLSFAVMWGVDPRRAGGLPVPDLPHAHARRRVRQRRLALASRRRCCAHCLPRAARCATPPKWWRSACRAAVPPACGWPAARKSWPWSRGGRR